MHCKDNGEHADRERWSRIGLNLSSRSEDSDRPLVVGVLAGEGIGPDTVGATLRVLSAVTAITDRTFEIVHGGPIGRNAIARCGKPLSDEVVAFCRQVFDRGGAVLSGPGGDRFVYDLRARFDLFFKLSPLKALPGLAGAGHLKPEYLRGVDILVVREVASGVYQGQWDLNRRPDGLRVARHSFSYSEDEVRRIVAAAARIARHRRGEMSVVLKDSGLPSVSRLWRDCADEIAAQQGVRCSFLDVDHAAYRLIQHAQECDLLVAPNLFGDILCDAGGVLMGGRGLTYSASFTADGAGVYQTNHGAAYDIADADRANPAGQLFSLAMLLHESFGLTREADLVVRAMEEVWSRGFRTADIAEPGCRVIGTREMADRAADAVTTLAERAAAV